MWTYKKNHIVLMKTI